MQHFGKSNRFGVPAPKPGALPTGPHPEISDCIIHDGWGKSNQKMRGLGTGNTMRESLTAEQGNLTWAWRKSMMGLCIEGSVGHAEGYDLPHDGGT